MGVRRPDFFRFSLLILALCGTTATVGIAPARAGDVTEWNAIAIDVLALGGQNAIIASRAAAMMHVAIHDALNSIDRRYEPYVHEPRAEADALPEAAIAAAVATCWSR